MAILDIDGDGDNDVVAVAGGYENSRIVIISITCTKTASTFQNSSIPPFSASVIRPFDFDHDGDIDLFVGSRVKIGMFPYANHSWLIFNDKGNLFVNPSSKLDLGMVTDAVWSDYDKDGWEDLIVVREWNSIAVLKNMGGKQLIPQIIQGFEDHHGLWYSIIAGDFDQDGDDDYITGNLGENRRFTVSDQYPLNLYAIDLDLDGNIDPLTTAYWKDKNGVMREYPINYLDELWAQSSFFRKKFGNYTSFSYASIDDMLDENILKRLEFKLHVNTTSSYILWNDKGKFQWEKLPNLLQFAPVKKMIVEDFNNDNFPDVLVSGNDYTYDVATGFYDANKGIVLLNKGKDQSFEVLTPSKSGILLQGMVESLLYFEGDTSLVMAGINRSKIAVFELVRKKKPNEVTGQ
jgi:hypothetical protein